MPSFLGGLGVEPMRLLHLKEILAAPCTSLKSIHYRYVSLGCLFVCIYLCIYIYIYLCIYVHIYIYILVHVYMYIRMYLYTYMYIYIMGASPYNA